MLKGLEIEKISLDYPGRPSVVPHAFKRRDPFPAVVRDRDVTPKVVSE